MFASTFTGSRVAPKQAAKSKKIDTSVVARRTKASAPAKKSAFKVRDGAIDGAYLGYASAGCGRVV